MLDSLFQPGTKMRAIAEAILAKASKGRWATEADIRDAVPGASKQIINKVRERLRDAGLITRKSDYAPPCPCGAPSKARGLCAACYNRRSYAARRALAVTVLALVLALPGYPGRWLVLADAEPAVTGGVAHCLGGEWPQWCVVEGRGDVVIDGVQVQWVTWLPGVQR